MKSSIEQAFIKKNQWLASQVDVAFPTPESLRGRDNYLSFQQSYTASFIAPISSLTSSSFTGTIAKVDFHRLTIRFAIVLASLWEEDKDDVLEFLTQLILEDDYSLYIGLEDGAPVACALIHNVNDELVTVFDVATVDKEQTDVKKSFVHDVIKSHCTQYTCVSHLGTMASDADKAWLNELGFQPA